MSEKVNSMNLKKKDLFDKNGWVVFEDLLSEDEKTKLNKIVDDKINKIAAGEEIEFAKIEKTSDKKKSMATDVRSFNNLSKTDKEFGELINSNRITDIASMLLGSEAKLLADILFNKPGFNGAEKPWHQDINGLGNKVISCWIALDDATVSNGCLKFIQGSHKWDELEHIDDIFGTKATLPSLAKEISKKNKVTINFDIDQADDDQLKEFIEEYATAQEIKAGSCIFHHHNMLHSSSKNFSPNRRRAYSIFYVGQ
ncbi:MAG: hypothetical protein COA79_06040 [Planctomycetota bacterium]|nr:MAG: hypothetical protein COA79_06040 [Planctomycetota bacterium]